MYALTSAFTFHVASGVFLALAIVSAVARTIVRYGRFRKFYLDDYILFLAFATLIAGTALIWVDIPYAYIEEITDPSAPPADYALVLMKDEKTQDAATILLQATICGVKFSFLFFFHRIISRTKRWYIIWWSVVLTITALSTPIIVLSDIIVCPYTGAEVEVKCTSNAAVTRENAVLITTTTLDILTDLLIISIPAIILWNVRLNVRRRLTLAGLLCLSIFMIVCAAIRATRPPQINGHSDILWLLLWDALEASVSVICVSVNAFFMLFHTSSGGRGINAAAAAAAPAAAGEDGVETKRNRYEDKAGIRGRLGQRFGAAAMKNDEEGEGTLISYPSRMLRFGIFSGNREQGGWGARVGGLPGSTETNASTLVDSEQSEGRVDNVSPEEV